MDLSRLVEESGALKSVSEYSFPNLPDQVSLILLRFEDKTYSLRVVESSDEIQLSDSIDIDGYLLEKPSSIWDKVIGKNILWAWELKNNQGYTDGVRFEFVEQRLIIELVVVASRFYIYEAINA